MLNVGVVYSSPAPLTAVVEMETMETVFHTVEPEFNELSWATDLPEMPGGAKASQEILELAVSRYPRRPYSEDKAVMTLRKGLYMSVYYLRTSSGTGWLLDKKVCRREVGPRVLQ